MKTEQHRAGSPAALLKVTQLLFNLLFSHIVTSSGKNCGLGSGDAALQPRSQIQGIIIISLTQDRPINN